jgi:hypothetical protein
MIVVASPKAPPSTVITINEHGAILLPMDAYEALGESAVRPHRLRHRRQSIRARSC